MFDPSQYELVDFGLVRHQGRKLERLAGLLVDRPSVGAERYTPAHPELWTKADARFDRSGASSTEQEPSRRGQWHHGPLPDEWIVGTGAIRLSLRLSPVGQLGLFAEQAVNWSWIGEQ